MKEKVEIRKAVVKDIPILNSISITSKRFWKYPEEWIAAWEKDLTVTELDFNDMLLYVAQVQNKIVGFGAIKEVDQEYEIMHLWILPPYMKRGIGKSILNSLLMNATKKKPIKVESDPNAIAFYKKMGFQKVGEIQSYPADRYLPVLIMNR